MKRDELIDRLYSEGDEAITDARALLKKKWALTRVRWGVFGYLAGLATMPVVGWVL